MCSLTSGVWSILSNTNFILSREMMQLVIFLVLGASICAMCKSLFYLWAISFYSLSLAIIAHGCSHGTVKFANQTTLSTSFGSLRSGTVIICINGKWSLVCSSQWSHTVAKVTCVDMGLSQYGKGNLLLRAIDC